jgi:hypothetical protein
LVLKLGAFVLLLSLPLTACAQTPSASVSFRTITVTETRVVVSAVGGVSPTGQQAPLTPHSLRLNFGECFTCHAIPLGHEGRMAAIDICMECHAEAPGWTEN